MKQKYREKIIIRVQIYKLKHMNIFYISRLATLLTKNVMNNSKDSN